MSSHPSPESDLLRRQAAAESVARAAGALVRRSFAERPLAQRPDLKGHQDYITETDGETETLIKSRLSALYPHDGFLGEEGGGELAATGGWIVDPIDGTANFARGIPAFCISIGHLGDGALDVGVIYDPIHDEMFSAARGHGARLDGRPMRVSGFDDLSAATVEAGWSSRRPPAAYAELVGRIKLAGANVRRGGSGALALAYVACGRIDAYVESHINPWDVAAGILLIEEAGGWCNDFFAGDGLRSGNAILGCTPQLRGRLSELTGIF